MAGCGALSCAVSGVFNERFFLSLIVAAVLFSKLDYFVSAMCCNTNWIHIICTSTDKPFTTHFYDSTQITCDSFKSRIWSNFGHMAGFNSFNKRWKKLVKQIENICKIKKINREIQILWYFIQMPQNLSYQNNGFLHLNNATIKKETNQIPFNLSFISFHSHSFILIGNQCIHRFWFKIHANRMIWTWLKTKHMNAINKI